MGSVGLQLVAQSNLRAPDSKKWRWLVFAAAALSAITWFGKPTYVLFTVAQILALLVDDEFEMSPKARLRILESAGDNGRFSATRDNLSVLFSLPLTDSERRAIASENFKRVVGWT